MTKKETALVFTGLGPPEIPRILKVNTDAAFKSKEEKDEHSRGGYLLVIGLDTSITDSVGLIGYGSKKLNRVCKSPTGAEILTISGGMDEVDFMYPIVQTFFIMMFTSEVLTDAYSMVSTKDKYTHDVSPNLTVDVAMIRERIRNGEFDLKHVPGVYNPSDGLTKVTDQALKVLYHFLTHYKMGRNGIPTDLSQFVVWALHACGNNEYVRSVVREVLTRPTPWQGHSRPVQTHVLRLGKL